MHCLSGYFTKPLFIQNSIVNIILYPHLKTLHKENSIMAIVTTGISATPLPELGCFIVSVPTISSSSPQFFLLNPQESAAAALSWTRAPRVQSAVRPLIRLANRIGVSFFAKPVEQLTLSKNPSQAIQGWHNIQELPCDIDFE